MAATRPIPFRSITPDAPDAELLRRFLDTRDEPAFAELVRRHGPVVYRVCRRVLGPAAADDAFQATFLVLACRAGRVRKAGSVGSFLVGVAGRVARQMRRRIARSQVPPVVSRSEFPRATDAPCPVEAADLAGVLDDELTRLPDHLRGPAVVCLLQGRTQEDAVAELGTSVRTLRRRLDEAKRLLRERLIRRGVVPAVTAGLVAGVGAPAGAVPEGLVSRTVVLVSDFLAGGAAASPAVVLAKGVAMGAIVRRVAFAVVAAAAGLTAVGVGLADEKPNADPGAAQPAPPAGAQSPARPGTRPEPPGLRYSGYDWPPPAAVIADGITVSGPTPAVCRAIHREAVFQRRELAKRWLGKELPPLTTEVKIWIWYRPTGPTAAAAECAFSDGRLGRAKVTLAGGLEVTLENGLPEQMTYIVLAEHFGRPIPRWAAGGMAAMAESAEAQASNDARCRNILNQGRGLRLKHLFPKADHSADANVPAIQGFTVARFLAGLKDPASVTRFVEAGLKDGWDAAAKAVYGFGGVDELEKQWMDSLGGPSGPARVDQTRIPPMKFDKE